MYSSKHIFASIALCLTFILTSSCSTTTQTTQDVEIPTFLEDEAFLYCMDPSKGPFQCVGSFRREDKSLIGGGTLINENTILTAAHVVEPSTKAHWFEVGGSLYLIESINLHEGYTPSPVRNDIATVKLHDNVPHIKFPEINIDPFFLQQFRPLTTVGFSLGIKKVSKPGIMFYYGSLEDEPNYFKMLPIYATMKFGDSGGGVFAERDGEYVLVGIVSYIQFYHGVVIDNSAVKVDTYRNWLQNAGVLSTEWSPVDEINIEMPYEATPY